MMTRKLDRTRTLFQRAKAVIPYGVNSNFRYWGDEETLVVTRGEGAYIWDADGNRYIDYRLAFGPIILGHAYPAVVERVAEAIRGGTLFAWTTPLEIEVAERIARMTGVEKVRLGNTGTEVTMHGLRIARAYTGREKFVKFEGQYHGMHDYVLFSTASTPLSALG
ncbi:MAG TPA: aminotransferase class III-fold pyridoxal phosphate-dependent enzyme, partial [Chloroflexi bacterium]|nr:aminotransferase class III-fold pyridoxal phosphate-dependent enzyme [Chloroflexota bacterium]